MKLAAMLVFLVVSTSFAATNQENRELPAMPAIKEPILFNTPEADAIISAMQILPQNSAWNEDVSKLPVHANSEKIIALIGPDKRLHWNLDMGYVIVPADQKKIDVKMTEYSDESDKGPFPMPDNAPVEDWPMNKKTLDDIQRNGKGDRHIVVIDPAAQKEYDFYIGRKTDKGWEAACEATFDLNTNRLRPKGWTSSDAAGLPIFPAVVRFDECERGMVEHALRFTIKKSKREYIYPATHFAGNSRDANACAMGQRFRLKADVNIDDMPKHAKAIALALKKYGMIVADNGGDWRISVAPDERIKGLDALSKLKGSDFEVIQTTGENEGPRANK